MLAFWVVLYEYSKICSFEKCGKHGFAFIVLVSYFGFGYSRHDLYLLKLESSI